MSEITIHHNYPKVIVIQHKGRKILWWHQKDGWYLDDWTLCYYGGGQKAHHDALMKDGGRRLTKREQRAFDEGSLHGVYNVTS